MRLQILYLSDLHIADETTLSETRLEDIVKGLNGLPSFNYCLIIISGDIVFSGKQEEYNLAKIKLLRLKELIQKQFMLKEEVKFFIVPGNHDNDYRDINFNRDDIALISNKECAYKKELKKLSAFFEFSKEFDCFQLNKVGEVRILNIDGYRLQVVMLNSAIYSAFRDEKKQNEKGLHYVPRRTMDCIEHFTQPADISLFVSHHSPEWFDEESKQLLEEYIERNINIAMWGHEHYYNKYSCGAEILKGGVLSGEKESSDFYSMCIDTEFDNVQIDHFLYDSRNRIYIKEAKGSIPLKSKQAMTPNDAFILENIDCRALSAPYKNHDIFVFPRLLNKINSFDFEKEILTMIDLDEVLKDCETCIISGDDDSGKSTLAKELYLHFMSQGISPIYLTPEGLKNKKLDRIIKYNFFEQYEESEVKYQEFVCLPKERKILIIDDVNLINTKKLFNDFLVLVRTQFSKIIITTSIGEFDVDEIIKHNIEDNTTLRVTIAPFYVDKRRELIEKVLEASNSYTCVEKQRYLDIIDKAIQNQLKYFALTPDFIVMFVNTFINQAFALDGNSNVFNAVFQANITNMIKSIPGLNVARALQLLQHIAYHIHINKIYPLPYDRFVGIIEEFNQEHLNALNPLVFSQELTRIGLVKVLDDGKVIFVSKNYLAYFIAQTLNGKVGTTEGNSEIEFLLRNICFGINADILLFLSFLTNRKEIIQLIIKECEFFLKDWEENNMDSANLKCLFVDFNAPKIAYPTSEQKAQRTQDIIIHEKKIVKAETIETTDIYDYNPEDISHYVHKQSKVLKLLEVVSKILPNFEHMLSRNEMMSIVDQIYSIPNKLAYYMLRPFDDHFEEAVEDIVEAYNACHEEKKHITKLQGIVLMQDIMTAMILSLYDFAARLSATEETYQLLLDDRYGKNMCNKIQQCLVLYQFNDVEKLGKLVEDIYDTNEIASIRFMMKKIARNYLLKHDVRYLHYGQRFIDKFFPDKKQYLLAKSKAKVS